MTFANWQRSTGVYFQSYQPGFAYAYVDRLRTDQIASLDLVTGWSFSVNDHVVRARKNPGENDDTTK